MARTRWDIDRLNAHGLRDCGPSIARAVKGADHRIRKPMAVSD
jgi:hypothetical protein